MIAFVSVVLRSCAGYSGGMMQRFLDWWSDGDPCPGEIAFGLFVLAVAWFIAQFGGGQ